MCETFSFARFLYWVTCIQMFVETLKSAQLIIKILLYFVC
jgi:hypothetical protein